VTNPTADFRQELIEIPVDSVERRLGSVAPWRVLDAAGLDVPYQITSAFVVGNASERCTSAPSYLLIDASVRPHGQAHFTIVPGNPPQFGDVCHGALHPERKDDLAWENDRGAYRLYGPALQRTGERSYGIDVWTKNTPELVVDDRYHLEDVLMMPIVDSLRRVDRHRGDSLYRTISYHYDHGRGLDPYQVGATLGCGAPALMSGGKIVYPYCFRTYQILDNGPLRFTVSLTYHPTIVEGDTLTEHRLVTLDKGSNFNRMTVWYEGLNHDMALCSGVVIHDADTLSVDLGKNYVCYADPTDNPPVINAQLYVACLFPEGIVDTRKQEKHALGILSPYRGQPYTYYFGSAWSRYDVRSLREWISRIDWYLTSFSHPLQVTLK
jgi:hypothetical protein